MPADKRNPQLDTRNKMISAKFFYDSLIQNGTDFFAGVPDSLLKSLCAYVTDFAPKGKHIIAANEGSATALACGYHFATGKIPLVYMQNSGIGNAVNPLLSLADTEVYSVPLLLVIGWRGEPGVHDEPQHVKQGKVTCALLDAMRIPYSVLPESEEELTNILAKAYSYMKQESSPYALVVRKNTFSEYKLKNNASVKVQITREEAIEKIMLFAPENVAFVSTTGMASRELYELREKHGMGHERDFLTVGSMGHASQIALSIAMHSSDKRTVFCIDGDGATIMQMGGLSTIGTRAPENLIHFVLNNGAHDSVGGQPTVALDIDLPKIALACGYKKVVTAETSEQLENILAEINKNIKSGKSSLQFVEVKVQKGARKDLGRPKSTPQENKDLFMKFLKAK